MDAVTLIKRYDSPETLYYLDPPYVSTAQFHYDGYTQENLDELLTTLTELKGGFIFSHYFSKALADWSDAHGMSHDIIDTQASIGMATGDKTRQEILIYNFSQRGLF